MSDIFLIRGLARDVRHWGTVIPLLQQKFLSSRIIPLELPGCGIYNRVQAPLKISDYVEFLRADFLKVKNREDCKIVAVSLGAMIAISWMQTYPNDFKAFIFINTSFAISPFYRRLLPSNWLQLFKFMFIKDRYKRELSAVSTVCNTVNYEKVAKEWTLISESAPVTGITFLRQLFSAALFMPKRERPQVPILLLVSLQDRMVSSRCSDDIAKLWNLPLKSHHTGGHELGTDDPDWVVKQIEDFFS